jgi:translation initiation factor IF-2
MVKIRIYELAKELGVENKDVLSKAQEFGLPHKTSHSSSLEPDEAELLRRAFIRAAIGTSPDTQVVTTRVDERTGEQKTVVESRKGNIVRRP